MLGYDSQSCILYVVRRVGACTEINDSRTIRTIIARKDRRWLERIGNRPRMGNGSRKFLRDRRAAVRTDLECHRLYRRYVKERVVEIDIYESDSARSVIERSYR